jgi:hypothetical protein
MHPLIDLHGQYQQNLNFEKFRTIGLSYLLLMLTQMISSASTSFTHCTIPHIFTTKL